MSGENAKKRLLNMLSTKFNTTVIGSLAVFEKYFGYLWGHGKDEVELTDEEYDFREIWVEAREELLDRGNHNSRLAQNEVSHYNVTSNRYITNLKTRDN